MLVYIQMELCITKNKAVYVEKLSQTWFVYLQTAAMFIYLFVMTGF
jgi:hypothetical protein